MHTTETGIYYTFIIGLTMLTLLLVIFVTTYVRQQKQRMREYKNQVLRDINLIEQERKRIAADLHDDLGSILASVRLGMENLAEGNPSNPIAKKTLELVDHSIERIKEISHKLLPGILQAKGLGAAIEELAEEIRLSGKTRVLFDNECLVKDFVPEKAIFVFRVLQEILTNSIKHANADLIRIQCTTQDNQLLLTVSDNGIGYTPEKLGRTEKKLGLQNIRARLELLEGHYDLQSSPGHGTQYKIQIPLASLIQSHEKKATYYDHTR